MTIALLESVGENDHTEYFMITLHETMLMDPVGIKPRPPDQELDAHLNELQRPGGLSFKEA